VANLNDLIDKPISDMTEDELVQYIYTLKKIKATSVSDLVRYPKKSKPVTNKEKKDSSFLKDLSQDELNLIASLIKQAGGKI